MRVKNEDLLDETGPVSLGANVTLKSVWLGHIVNYSIQLVFSGTPDGEFYLEGSNDTGRIDAASDSNQQSHIANWTVIADSTFTVTAAGDVMWDVQNAGYSWVRVKWARNSSTGSLTSARCYVKGV